MPEPLRGHCLCSAVRFTATPIHVEMDACHCGMCRRWSGSALMTVHCDPSMEIEGEENLGVYVSSDHAERCFCTTCGTSLFWRMRDRSLLTVSAQAFEEPGRFPFKTEIFIDQKPDNYAFANDTRKMTEAEVFAAFSGLTG